MASRSRAPVRKSSRSSSPTRHVTNKGRTPAKIKTGLSEVGFSGLNQSGGIIREDFLTDLRGPAGRKIFKEMTFNDSVVGSILFAATMLIRQASWGVKAASESAEDKKWADYINSCRDDMSMTWADVVSEVMTMLSYGWAAVEEVYKKRNGYIRNSGDTSKFTDGLIGWKKLPLRSQDSLQRWEFDERGGVLAMHQLTLTGQRATIPIHKMLLFRTTSNKNNPEGVSALRTAYRPWYFKKRIEEIEGIGIERDLAGLPVLKTPEDVDIWNANDADAVATKAVAEKLVQSIRRDEQEGVLLPFGWELNLISSAGKKSIDPSATIARYNTMIAMTVLADFIILGHNNRYGSFALASSKTHMFSVAIGGWLDAIADVFNRYAIPRLLEINGVVLENPPRLVHGDVEVPDLAELGAYIKNLAVAGMQVFPNPEVERHLLKVGGLPWENAEVGRGDGMAKPGPNDEDDDDKNEDGTPKDKATKPAASDTDDDDDEDEG